MNSGFVRSLATGTPEALARDFNGLRQHIKISDVIGKEKHDLGIEFCCRLSAQSSSRVYKLHIRHIGIAEL